MLAAGEPAAIRMALTSSNAAVSLGVEAAGSRRDLRRGIGTSASPFAPASGMRHRPAIFRLTASRVR